MNHYFIKNSVIKVSFIITVLANFVCDAWGSSPQDSPRKQTSRALDLAVSEAESLLQLAKKGADSIRTLNAAQVFSNNATRKNLWEQNLRPIAKELGFESTGILDFMADALERGAYWCTEVAQTKKRIHEISQGIKGDKRQRDDHGGDLTDDDADSVKSSSSLPSITPLLGRDSSVVDAMTKLQEQSSHALRVYHNQKKGSLKPPALQEVTQIKDLETKVMVISAKLVELSRENEDLATKISQARLENGSQQEAYEAMKLAQQQLASEVDTLKVAKALLEAQVSELDQMLGKRSVSKTDQSIQVSDSDDEFSVLGSASQDVGDGSASEELTAVVPVGPTQQQYDELQQTVQMLQRQKDSLQQFQDHVSGIFSNLEDSTQLLEEVRAAHIALQESRSPQIQETKFDEVVISLQPTSMSRINDAEHVVSDSGRRPLIEEDENPKGWCCFQ